MLSPDVRVRGFFFVLCRIGDGCTVHRVCFSSVMYLRRQPVETQNFASHE